MIRILIPVLAVFVVHVQGSGLKGSLKKLNEKLRHFEAWKSEQTASELKPKHKRALLKKFGRPGTSNPELQHFIEQHQLAKLRTERQLQRKGAVTGMRVTLPIYTKGMKCNARLNDLNTQKKDVLQRQIAVDCYWRDSLPYTYLQHFRENLLPKTARNFEEDALEMKERFEETTAEFNAKMGFYHSQCELEQYQYYGGIWSKCVQLQKALEYYIDPSISEEDRSLFLEKVGEPGEDEIRFDIYVAELQNQVNAIENEIIRSMGPGK